MLDGRVLAGPTTLRVPASLLIGLGAPWNTVRPGGVLSVTWDRLAISPRRFEGNVTAEWQFASSRQQATRRVYYVLAGNRLEFRESQSLWKSEATQ